MAGRPAAILQRGAPEAVVAGRQRSLRRNLRHYRCSWHAETYNFIQKRSGDGTCNLGQNCYGRCLAPGAYVWFLVCCVSPSVRSPAHSPVHPSACSPSSCPSSHPSGRPLVRPFFLPRVRPPDRSYVCPSAHSFGRLPAHLPVRPFVLPSAFASARLFARTSARSFVCPFAHPLVRHPSIRPFVRPSVLLCVSPSVHTSVPPCACVCPNRKMNNS